MVESKWFLLSKGILGPLLSLAGVALAANGIEFSAEEQRMLIDQVSVAWGAIMALVGNVVGIIGRLQAKKTLTLLPRAGNSASAGLMVLAALAGTLVLPGCAVGIQTEGFQAGVALGQAQIGDCELDEIREPGEGGESIAAERGSESGFCIAGGRASQSVFDSILGVLGLARVP